MRYGLLDIETRANKEFLADMVFEEGWRAKTSGAQAAEAEETAYREYAAGLVADESKRTGEVQIELPGTTVAVPMLPLLCHLPISIAIGIVDDQDWLLQGVTSLCIPEQADLQRSDPEMFTEILVREFWQRAARFQARSGCLVTFNGRRFDLPVLELASLRFQIPTGEHYTKRYGNRYRFQADHHIDVLDHLSNHGAVRLKHGTLGDLMTYIREPQYAKGGVAGADVQRLYDDGELERLHAYCRDDVRRLYRLFLHFMHARNAIPEQQYMAARDTALEMEA